MDKYLKVNPITFEETLPIWSKHLWPGRKSDIEQVSCINQVGDIDVEIKNFSPEFYGCFLKEEMAGVISCHPINKKVLRLRGIYVFEKFRKNGVGSLLIRMVKQRAFEVECQNVFGLVRTINQPYFERHDFAAYKSISGYEYGPHVLMGLGLNSLATPL